MATQVNMHQAKTRLSKLVKQAEQGEDVLLARAGKPVARIVPIAPEKPTGRIGFLEGQFNVPDDIKTPFAEEIEEMFYGNPDKFKS